MKVLFSMRHLGSFRLYESVLRLLAERGHRVHIVVERGERLGWAKSLDKLVTEFPSIAWSASPPERPRVWFELTRVVPNWLNYLRYFDPYYANAPKLRERARERVPQWLARLSDERLFGGERGLRLVRRWLRIIELALPRNRAIDSLIARFSPDVVLLTPVIHLGSPQVDILRSAKASGIRTALCVGSWDHLSSKALIRDVPGLVIVWNETQKQEAIELHGLDGHRVVVTGAQCYDEWFQRQPSRTREDFCGNVSLPPERPYILYVCSALFQGSPVEAAFVQRWISHLRASVDPNLRRAGILIRPHPTRLEEWKAIDCSGVENVTLYGANPVSPDTKSDYFESMYYSAAVVGLNTSALLEAGIVGRPVHTILLPEFWENQEGTLHFRYLLTVGGGLLRTARGLEEHGRQLTQSLMEGPDSRARNRSFVEAFVRPHGLDVPASPVFLSAVEEMVRAGKPSPQRPPLWAYVLRPILFPIAVMARLALAGDGSGPIDRTSQEVQGTRLRDRRRQRRLAEKAVSAKMKRRNRAAKARLKAAKTREAERTRILAQQDRERRLQEHDQRKAALTRQKEKRKAQRQWQKRRDLIRDRFKRKMKLLLRGHRDSAEIP